MRGLGKVYSMEEIIDLIVPVLQKYDVKSATLFGSYAKGTMDEGSDMDLVVDTNLKGFGFTAILADLFDIFGYGNVDLYTWDEVNDDVDLALEIDKTGVMIYGIRSKG